MGESRANLPDVLLTPASLPYEVGAALSALICWPQDVVKFERLMPRLCHYAIRLMVEAEPGSGMRLWSMRPAYVLLDQPVRQFPPVDFRRLERQLELGQMLMPVIRHHAVNRAGGLPAPETPTQERLADAWAAGKGSHDTLTAGNFGERILRPALPVLHLVVAALHIIDEEAVRGNVIDWRQFLVNPGIIANWLTLARYLEPVVADAFPNARDRIMRLRSVQFDFS